MNTVIGDLIALAIEGRFDVIVHGCNCFCSMGNGIAKPIKHTFPEAFEADCNTKKGDRSKLGGYSWVTVNRNGHDITIINAYTQFDFWREGPRVDYDAVASVFSLIAKNFGDKRIGYPMIGAGLAGGDWARISAIIEDKLQGCDHTLVTLPS